MEIERHTFLKGIFRFAPRRPATPGDDVVVYELAMSPAVSASLEQIISESGREPSDFITMAIFIFLCAMDAQEDGMHVGIADDPGSLRREFVELSNRKDEGRR